jgi:hypothetical protein
MHTSTEEIDAIFRRGVRSRHCRVVTRLPSHPLIPDLPSTLPARVNNHSGRDVVHLLFFKPPVRESTRKGSSHQCPAILLCRSPGEAASPRPFFVLAHPSLDPNSRTAESQVSLLGSKSRAHSSSERREVRSETRDSRVVFWSLPFGVRHLRRAQEVQQLVEAVAYFPHRRSSDPRFHQS